MQQSRQLQIEWSTSVLCLIVQILAITMECIVANVEHMRFDIEIALDEQYGALPLPFTGMDSMFFYVLMFMYPLALEVKFVQRNVIFTWIFFYSNLFIANYFILTVDTE